MTPPSPQPSPARGEGEKANNKGLRKGLAVVDFLITGEILEWKGLDQVAAGAGVSRNEAYAALNVLIDEGWVEKDSRGFRACYTGLVKYVLEAQECLMNCGRKLGLKG
jgi:hypothetical protein